MRKHGSVAVCQGCGFSAAKSEALGQESAAHQQHFADQVFSQLRVNSEFRSAAFAAQQQNQLKNQAQAHQAQHSAQMYQALQMQNSLAARGLADSPFGFLGLICGK